MESIIANLVSRFEKGSLSRRELIEGLALLAASGTAATAAPSPQTSVNFTRANIDHVSIKVADLQRSIDFYKTMFGFTVREEVRSRVACLKNSCIDANCCADVRAPEAVPRTVQPRQARRTPRAAKGIQDLES